MLYRPEAFEPLPDELWDEGRVRAAIRAIVGDADAVYDARTLWPADAWDAWTSPLPLKNLYTGAAGIVWALDALAQRCYAETRLDLPAAAARALELWRAEPDLPREIELPTPAASGLLTGEAGILLVAWRLAPSRELADDLEARIRANAKNEAADLMWGSPGTLHAARALLDATSEERWADAWRESAEQLLRARDGAGVWEQRLYGERYSGLGPAHGLVGNVHALLRGDELLDAERREALRRDTAAILARAAVVEDGLANWPYAAGRGLVGGDGEIRLQWCAGAPGIVIAASDSVDEDLLVAGAELVWRAGPPAMVKGPCICHGTAGNGYALLKTFERTGDERWLERARRFAVHALGQAARARATRGRGRYSLWTGDVGAAIYAADCIDARAAYPILDA